MFKNFLNYLLIFLVISLALQLFFFEPPQSVDAEEFPITIETTKKSYSLGKIVEINIKNNTESRFTFKNPCPTNPFTVLKTTNNLNQVRTSTPEINCLESNDQALQNIVIQPNRSTRFRYTYWTNSLFDTIGEYKIGTQFNYNDRDYEIFSNTFTIKERGFWGKLWINVFYQPIYNFLIWIINITPGYSLGLGIIILTLLLRIALYFPNQKALLAQKRLAEVQPKLNEVKEKYKNDQQKMAEETMKIWKQHKVNPASSCLPILIQFPILIALFYVIQDGLNPDKTWLLYNFQQNFNLLNIETNFLNILNLTEKNIIVLPLIVGALQFLQLKLAMSNQKKPSQKSADPQAMVQNMMLYLMPGMIAVFTASLPAGVGLYWGTSTLFGIGQQFIANKQVEKELASQKNKIHRKKRKREDVRVIDVN